MLTMYKHKRHKKPNGKTTKITVDIKKNGEPATDSHGFVIIHIGGFMGSSRINPEVFEDFIYDKPYIKGI